MTTENRPLNITVPFEGELHIFKVIPLTSIQEFIENAEILVKPSDVALGEEMGWWKICEEGKMN